MDTWFKQQPDPVRRPDVRSYITQGDFQLDAGQRPEIITLDKWLPSKPDYVFDRERNQYLYPPLIIDAVQLTQPEYATLDKWSPSKPDYIFDHDRNQYTYPGLFFIEAPPPVEDVTLDKWFEEISRPIFKIKSNKTYPNSFFVNAPPFDENITLDKWFSLSVGRFEKRVSVPFQSSFFVELPPVVESITLDKWFSETSRPVYKFYRNYLFPLLPFFSQDKESISIDKWFNETSRPTSKSIRTDSYQSSFFVNVSPLVESVTLDKWFVPLSVPRQRIKHIYFAEGMFYVQHIEAPVFVELDRWYRQASEPLRKKKNINYIYAYSADSRLLLEEAVPVSDIKVILRRRRK